MSENRAPSARCTLVLIRHAHTGLAGRFCGQIDPPLSEEGLAQLVELSERVRSYPFTHVISSDLQRTRQTAESIARPRNLQVQLLPSLREFAFGEWEGLTWEEVMARDSDYAQRWVDQHPALPAPGGEVFADFRERTRRAMNGIADQMHDGCVAVVTHAGVIRTFLCELAETHGVASEFFKCDYASCWEVWREDDEWNFPTEYFEHLQQKHL